MYDTRAKSAAPIYVSTVKTGKHTDPVWEVCWVAEDLAKNLNFYSISSDGRVTLWTLSKSKLDYTDLMHLKLTGAEGADASAADDDALSGLAGGCCFDFSRLNDHLFLVGTEEGRIHKCSRAYQSQYLETYEGHYMAVYSVRWNNFNPKLFLSRDPRSHTPHPPYQVRWNNFNPKLFLSCSADWTVKMWEHTRKHCLMSFDLNHQVGDVAWTPVT